MNEIKQIQVTVREVYGRRLIYPVCPQAKLFARIGRQQTLQWQALEHIKALGFTVREVNETIL